MLINLTYPIKENMFKYPSQPDVNIVRREATESGGRFSSSDVTATLSTHHGTHIDFPSHKLPTGQTASPYYHDRYASRFLGLKAYLVDLSFIAAREDKGVSRWDLNDRLDVDAVDNADALLFYTGYCDRMMAQEGRLRGDDKTAFEGEFTYFTEEAARFVADQLPQLSIVGIDSFAFDRSGSNSEAHRAFFKEDILLLENIIGLSKLRGKGRFELNCYPVVILGADAAWATVFADVPDE